MWEDRLTRDLEREISKIPIIDAHSHIDPLKATARSLDDILGYHYYTELAHSAGMDQAPLAAQADPRERVRAILGHLDRIDNTAQYSWFLEIAKSFLGFKGDRITVQDADPLCELADKAMTQPDWEQQVWQRSNLEQVFLTNAFDDPLDGFDTSRYVPCLRTDDLVFHLGEAPVCERLVRATNVEIHDSASLGTALHKVFEHFAAKGARACAISLPPYFIPQPVDFGRIELSLSNLLQGDRAAGTVLNVTYHVFWTLAELCREFQLPFDLMIGVNRRVYVRGVFQGQDLFDQRTSLVQYAELFNSFPEVIFPISVLSSGQNQELVSYSWIFPNVVTNGHWWYSNIPGYIESDCRARLQAVPKTKQIGYYSDAYKLEFVLPKYKMYRHILARVLADDFVRAGIYSEQQAIDFARLLLRENAQRIFGV